MTLDMPSGPGWWLVRHKDSRVVPLGAVYVSDFEGGAFSVAGTLLPPLPDFEGTEWVRVPDFEVCAAVAEFGAQDRATQGFITHDVQVRAHTAHANMLEAIRAARRPTP